MIYLITDNILFSSKILANLKANDVEARGLSSPAALREAIAQQPPACVLANLNARTYDAVDLVKKVTGEGQTVIAFCGHADIATREAGIAAGAARVIANSAITMNAAGALKDAGIMERGQP
jgi:DNA-binding NtrC family response regulator